MNPTIKKTKAIGLLLSFMLMPLSITAQETTPNSVIVVPTAAIQIVPTIAMPTIPVAPVIEPQKTIPVAAPVVVPEAAAPVLKAIQPEPVKQTTFKVNTAYDEKNTDCQLFNPENNKILFKNALYIKGLNRYQWAVFMNGKPFQIRSDGRFIETLPLTSNINKQTLWFCFTTPQHEVIAIKRNMLKLSVPETMDQYPELLPGYAYFINTAVVYQPETKKPNTHVTRADLAYLLTQLTQTTLATSNLNVFEDVPANHWAASAIQYCADQQVLMEYPDGTFKPQSTVNKIEYILAIIRAKKLELDRSETPLPYLDIKNKHWTAKYIRTALKNGWLNKEKALNPSQPLTWLDLYKLLGNIPEVKTQINALTDFNTGYEDTPAPAILEPAYAYIADRIESEQKFAQISLDSPLSNQIIFNNPIILKGKITPAELFTINNQTIIPNADGTFEASFKVDFGPNTFNIQAKSNESKLVVLALKPFEDLNKHWIKETASKLRYSNCWPDEQNFKPEQRITRAEFASLLCDALKLTPKIDNMVTPNPITDMTPTAAGYQDMQTLISRNIFSNRNGLVLPDMLITRAEALTAIIRACEWKVDPPVSRLPFRDIPKRHWVAPYVKTAVEQGLITPAYRFNPNRGITRAELASLFAHIPQIKALLPGTEK